ncbi:histidine phosphatase family protein [Clostridiaceae bacterium UIB06]|uniref:Histidine phosphatase family protein n=1 Tax=Clostridium thailandense TaxID=2794346 RepID=A0A949U3A5_9CLOT|nr:histidine phosphatase family protein [Clostridium thailandense]MBV7276670.1 histidine phosphatase family protein [Clostridium thailandense]MCH5137448.1 histidine phosphatase family protein [Clostridiaceae bacterium UIB06]
MKETIIYLARHGQTEWNLEKRMQGHKNSPLTKLGITQAEGLYNRLLEETIDIIYSSGSKRAYDTAAIIGGNRCIPIIVKQELREIHMGDWEGLQQSDIISRYYEAWSHFWNKPHLYVPTGLGESYQELQDRVIPVIKDIINLNGGKTILIVTHRITLKVIMAHFNSQEIQNIWDTSDIEPASLCKISIKDGVFRILMYGDTSHYR